METPKPHAEQIKALDDGLQYIVNQLRDGFRELSQENESLKLKNSEPNSTNFQLDGKPLTDGEKSLIRAFRKVKIMRVNCDDPTKWKYLLTNKEVFNADVVVRVESESDEECSAIGDAIFMIKMERAKNETK